MMISNHDLLIVFNDLNLGMTHTVRDCASYDGKLLVHPSIFEPLEKLIICDLRFT